MNNKILVTLVMFLLVGASFAVSDINVRVSTDKNEYAPGDKINVVVALSPKDSPVTYYDVSMYLESNNQDAISFPLVSGQNSMGFSNPFFSERSGAYVSAKGNYYGWWIFGTRDGSKDKGQLTLTASSELTRFIATANPLPSGTSKTVTITPTNVKIIDYHSLKPISVTANVLSKTITIKSSACTVNADCGSGNYCVNLVCKDGAMSSSCTGPLTCDSGFCVNSICTDGQVNSNCAADADCQSGFQCYNSKCQTGDVGSPCTTASTDCDAILECVSSKCIAPTEPQICGTNLDCDSDGISNKDDICPIDKTGPKTTPFTSGAFKGCMKADINLDGQINSADITKFIDYYGKRDTYPSIILTGTYWPADLSVDNILNSADITQFIEAYNNRS